MHDTKQNNISINLLELFESISKEEFLDFNLSEEQLSLQLKARNFVEKYIKKVNLDSYKKAIRELQAKMNTWDMEAFSLYTQITKEAKSHNIK